VRRCTVSCCLLLEAVNKAVPRAMSSLSLDLFLVVLFASVALCVVSLVGLRASTPWETQAYGELFTTGAVPPYTLVTSLRVKYFLPWINPIYLAEVGLVPRLCLWLARIGAYGAVGALVAMVLVGAP
jgi:hypothetical protein